MSWAYDNYLFNHIENVKIAFIWLTTYCPASDIYEILPEVNLDKVGRNIDRHDASKSLEEEYDPYDNYFNSKRTQKVKDEFNLAWLHHIHHNPHHWQYWVLIQDKGNAESYYSGKIVALDMPDDYIMEMICDWWSFSWAKHNEVPKFDLTVGLYEIFKWYKSNKECMLLSTVTRQKVEALLELIKRELQTLEGL